jgi:hypothetical protein
MSQAIDERVPSEYVTHEPTADEIATLESVAVGSFKYPRQSLNEYRADDGSLDEGAYQEACSDLEAEIREEVFDYFLSRGSNPRIRLSEMEPGEIRAYF